MKDKLGTVCLCLFWNGMCFILFFAFENYYYANGVREDFRKLIIQKKQHFVSSFFN